MSITSTGKELDEWRALWRVTVHHEGRKVVMIIDNCPAQPHIENLKATTVVFLPINCLHHSANGSRRCPFESKIPHYPSHRITTALDNNKAIPKFNIREGMYMLARVWDQVSTNTIVNCFKKANISARSQIETISDLDDPLSYLK